MLLLDLRILPSSLKALVPHYIHWLVNSFPFYCCKQAPFTKRLSYTKVSFPKLSVSNNLYIHSLNNIINDFTFVISFAFYF